MAAIRAHAHSLRIACSRRRSLAVHAVHAPSRPNAPPPTKNAADDQPFALLNSGHKIPIVGLGTWGGAKGEVRDAVYTALTLGYRHVDCAAFYNNEGEVGEALQKAFADGVVTREQVFITSKIWDAEPETVEPKLRKTLADLQLSYLDLYLVHFPKPLPHYLEIWKAMEAAADKGLAKSIGVSNLGAIKLQAVLDVARIKPAVNQVEGHPYFRNEKLRAFCAAKGVHVTAYSPLGTPETAEALGNQSLPVLLEDPVVAKVAKAVGKTPGQVLVRWAVQRGTSVLPKSVKPERLASNLDVHSWSIPDDLFEQLNALGPQKRRVHGVFLVQPQGPFKSLADVWDGEE